MPADSVEEVIIGCFSNRLLVLTTTKLEEGPPMKVSYDVDFGGIGIPSEISLGDFGIVEKCFFGLLSIHNLLVFCPK